MNISLESAADLLRQYRSFVLTTHVNPDGDAVGSLLALAHALREMGKEVVCFIDDDMPKKFLFLPGAADIEQPSQTVVSCDLLVVLDASDLERVGKVAEIVDAPVLNIDHHISNAGFADYVCLDGNRAATGEILYDLLQILGTKITKSVAVCLYTAIATDCGFFKYANTKPETLEIAAELMRCGVQPNLISEELEARPLATLKALGKVIDAIELFDDGKIACLCITKEMLDFCDSTEGFIEFARTVEGVELALMVKYADENICRISMRSKRTDVSKIALSFGGGGHKRAAGCTIRMPLLAAKDAILGAITAEMEEA